MNIKPIAAIAAAAGLLAVASPSFAAPVTLTFEGANSFGSITNFYNGGTDIPSVEPSGVPASGPNYHIAFGADALAFANDEFFQYFSNAPSPTVMGAVGSDATLTATDGFSFIDALSFSYSASQAFTLEVLGAGNAVIASFNLGATNGSCGDSPFCVWTQATLNFAGYATGFRFGGGYDALNGTIAAFDNIMVNEVPIPAAGWLLASGLVMLGRMRRKRTA